VTTLFPKLMAKVKESKVKKPKTSGEFMEICKEGIQRHLKSRFNGRKCEVVLHESIAEKPRLSFTSMLNNGKSSDHSYNDLSLDLSLDHMAYGIYILTRGDPKWSKLEVRLLSLERVELVEAKDPVSFPFDEDAQMVIKNDAGWLLLKWDLGPEGLLEWMRTTESVI